MSQVNSSNLIWIDLEMTGLDSSADRIIEIATIVTDGNLDILAEGPELAIHQSDAILDGMDAWNTRQHNISGLVERVRGSTLSESEAEAETLAFLRQWVPERASPMCGNTICQDRRFMARLMPELEAYFHYRHIDVSTIKELARRWSPSVVEGVTKESNHRAMGDIRDSINELRHYRTHFLKLPL